MAGFGTAPHELPPIGSVKGELMGADRRRSSGGPMMKQIASLLVTAASLAFAPNLSHAQSIMSPCMRVCEPPARLNTQNCSCEESARTQTKDCALACPNPDQKLDLRRCRCVRK